MNKRMFAIAFVVALVIVVIAVTVWPEAIFSFMDAAAGGLGASVSTF